MTELLSSIGQMFLEIRNTGNYWLRRALLVLLLWPLLMIFASLLPPNAAMVVVPIVALVPLLAAVFWVVGAVDLLLVAAATTAIPLVRRVLIKLAVATGMELVIGVYFSLVPTSTDRALVPALLLIFAAILFLSLGKKRGVILALLILASAVLTMIFFLGGRKEAGAKLHEITSAVSDGIAGAVTPASPQAKPPVPTYTLRCGSGTGVVLPGGLQRAAFLVPVGRCDSEYIVLPKGYWQMNLHTVEGLVEQKDEYDRLMEISSPDSADKSSPAHPRELRIKNIGSGPAVVEATFAY